VPGRFGEGEPDGNGQGTGLLLSPVVRRLMAEHGLTAQDVPGSGPGGRITRADVLAVIDARRGAGSAGAPAPAASPAPAAAPPPAAPSAAPAASPAPAAPSAAPAPAAAPSGGTPTPAASPAGSVASGALRSPDLPASRPAEVSRVVPGGASMVAGPDDQVVPFSNIRRRTAEHMVRSKATSPHTLVVTEADFEAVDRVRAAVGERFREEEGFSLTYLPFVARAVIEALRRWPHLNASVGDDSLVVHRRIHLGIAVDLSFEGLVAPVVHDADALSVRGLARAIRDLATRARSKQLGPDDLAGGTFTITNPGPYGTLLTGPIINQPQVAILSTDTVRRRPVVATLPDGSEAIVIHSVGLLSLTWDHRAVDGAYAAAFVHDVAELIAGYDWSREL
jgi:pyruvate dehydrogenase E2 component (dihydrolipoamide acetyltransferase)